MQLVSWLSFKRYSMEALVLAIYDGDRENMVCPDDKLYCHYRSPRFLVSEMGMKPHNFYFDMLMMVAMFVAVKIVTYFTLRRTLNVLS